MRISTKILVILAISLFCVATNAQTICIRGGFNFATVLDEDTYTSYTDDHSMNFGINLGPTIDFELMENFAFSTGLLLSKKGTIYNAEIWGADINVKSNLIYLNIPITFKSSYTFSRRKKGFIQYGLYTGIGVAGRIKDRTFYDGREYSGGGLVHWGYDPDKDDFRTIDIGLSIGMGLDIKHLFVGINYEHGLTNIDTDMHLGRVTKNRVLSISSGYIF